MLVQATDPDRLGVMLKKLRTRLVDESGFLSKRENLKWLQSQCTEFEPLAKGLDPNLWGEAEEFSAELKTHAEEILGNIKYKLGGGGAYTFLYFVTRYKKPNCIVETGVAAGFSSCAFLSAIEANGKGRLYSSDFPYFRLPNPESYIGVLVKDSHKKHWKLHIDGDDKNLPRIFNSVDQVDIFHYDSDKSYSGRRAAISMAERKLSSDGIILIDDIQDNSFFHDYVMTNGTPSWRIFESRGKYLGMIGNL